MSGHDWKKTGKTFISGSVFSTWRCAQCSRHGIGHDPPDNDKKFSHILHLTYSVGPISPVRAEDGTFGPTYSCEELVIIDIMES
jgi:hypothetical protein